MTVLNRPISSVLGRVGWPILRARLHGNLLYYEPRHALLIRAIRRGRIEPLMYRLFSKACERGATVVDGGAHLGIYTLLAAQSVGLAGRVHAFEPHPRSATLLRKSLSAANLAARVQTHEVALSDRNGFSLLHAKPRGNQTASSLVHRADRRVSYRVRTVRLDDALHESVDVVKLDIEGAELSSLTGMRRLLGENEDVVLFVECNPSALRLAGHQPRDLISELTSAGFEMRLIDEPGRTVRRFTDSELVGKTSNLLCARDQDAIDRITAAR